RLQQGQFLGDELRYLVHQLPQQPADALLVLHGCLGGILIVGRAHGVLPVSCLPSSSKCPPGPEDRLAEVVASGVEVPGVELPETQWPGVELPGASRPAALPAVTLPAANGSAARSVPPWGSSSWWPPAACVDARSRRVRVKPSATPPARNSAGLFRARRLTSRTSSSALFSRRPCDSRAMPPARSLMWPDRSPRSPPWSSSLAAAFTPCVSWSTLSAAVPRKSSMRALPSSFACRASRAASSPAWPVPLPCALCPPVPPGGRLMSFWGVFMGSSSGGATRRLMAGPWHA